MSTEKTDAELLAIGERLRTQDNRMTSEPMFCLQIRVRDVGYDSNYADGDTVWIDMQSGCYEEVAPNTDGAEEFGYKDRWETVMVAFTEQGIADYMKQDGHNVRRRAHNGETRIYVESFNRCREMIKIREYLSGTRPMPERTGEVAELRAEVQEQGELREKLAGLLTGVAAALNGDPGPLHLHSWHNLPEIANTLRAEVARLKAELEKLRESNRPPVYEDHPGWGCKDATQAYFGAEAAPMPANTALTARVAELGAELVEANLKQQAAVETVVGIMDELASSSMNEHNKQRWYALRTVLTNPAAPGKEPTSGD